MGKPIYNDCCYSIVNCKNKPSGWTNMQQLQPDGSVDVYDLLGNHLYSIKSPYENTHWSDFVCISDVMQHLGITRNAVQKRAKRGVSVKMKMVDDIPLYSYLKP